MDAKRCRDRVNRCIELAKDDDLRAQPERRDRGVKLAHLMGSEIQKE